MTFKNDQNEIALPTKSTQLRSSVAFLPRFFRTEANKKFLQSTLDQLIQPGVAEKINGYVGRTTSKAFSPSDNYLPEINKQREDYQLEPALVIKDSTDNVIFYKDYNDYMNQLSAFGVDTSNHDKINSQETYAWNPHIDWDKFVNFREYYWLPMGPQPVPVRAKSKEVIKTYQVSLGETDGYTHYIFTPDGKTANPTLRLFRGEKYRFEINTPGHPIAFAVQRTFTPGTALLVAGSEGIRGQGQYDAELFGNVYDLGDWIVKPSAGSVTFEEDINLSTIYPDGINKFTEDGEELAVVYVDQGVIEFKIPDNAPDNLYYISKYDVNTSGLVNIFNIEENTEKLDVNNEIIGMKTYRSGNGIDLTNGLKIYFQGNVEPEIYKNGYWYVEGVGNQIRLIKETDLLVASSYTDNTNVPFDNNPFDSVPFSDSAGFPQNKDYLIINRASLDKNPWSRNNRWFHRQVIEYAATINSVASNLDQELRAKRPIIEFEAGLKLYNFGTYAKSDVDLVDDYTTDIFSKIEGSIGYNIDNVDLVDGMRILFIADTDNFVNGRIYKVKFVEVDDSQQISLINEEDTEPLELETVFVKNGKKYSGKTLHYENNKWKLAQEKRSVNQPPLFSLCCPAGNDYANKQIFDSTTFSGNKIFSYAIGEGTNDAELGFPLTYKNIENFGDIVFECNLLSDVLSYQDNDALIEVSTSTSNLKKYTSRLDFTWENAWNKIPMISKQKVLRQYIASVSKNNMFEVDMFNNASSISDLKIQVFVNNKIKNKDVEYVLTSKKDKLFIEFLENLLENDVVLIKAYTKSPKNNNGWYEFPINLERNPLNNDVKYFTLGEVNDHVDSMIEDLPQFLGVFPGISNLRDISNLSKNGKRFVKHTGPLNLPIYHITNKDFNIIKAIRNSKKEYARFKRIFLEIAETLGFDGTVKLHVDKVLNEINKDKVKTQPFYFSDMLAYGNASVRSYRVLESGPQYYPLTVKFDLNLLSNKSILIYLNEEQLVYKKHYDFTQEGFVYVYSNHKEDDIIDIVEYETTNGSFIPPTPTKLGFYPKYEPLIVIDDTYVFEEPNKNEPYKIYGQLDETINQTTGWFYPVYESKTSAITEDKALGGVGTAKECKLIGLNKILYMPASNSNLGTEDTYNYPEYTIGVSFVQGHDGSLIKTYKDYRDQLLLEIEKRIFNNIKIDYNKTIVDINDFVGGYYRNTNYSKEEIDNLLINDFIDWSKLVDIDYTVNSVYKRENSFTYNYSNMEAPNGNLLSGFWRSVYKTLLDTDRPHTHPWECLGFSIKPSWWNEVYGPAPYTKNNTILWNDIENGIVREPNKQIKVLEKYARPGLTSYIPVSEKGKLLSPLDSGFAKNFFFRFVTQNFKFGDHAPVEAAWRKSSEYPYALLIAWTLYNPAKLLGLGFDLSRIEKNLAGQTTYSESGKMISLNDLVFPNTFNEENITLTSGLVNYIYNYVASNILKVYTEYKTQLTGIQNQLGFKLAGFSEKQKIKLILDSRSPRQSAEGGTFVPYENYTVSLNTSSPVDVAIYSGVIVEKVSNGYLIRGYSQEKPYFNYYYPIVTNTDRTITVGGISEVTTPWAPNKSYVKDQIVENNFKFYRVINNFTSGITFSNENLIELAELPLVGGKRATIRKSFNKNILLKLNYGSRLATSQDVVDFLLGYEKYLIDQGFKFENFNSRVNEVEDWKLSVKEFLFWTTQGWAEGTTIVLSPSANKIDFSRKYTTVDDLYDKFYDYSILKSDGSPLEPSFNSITRNINEFGIIPTDINDGIYHIRLPLVQKEHVVIIDNQTVFGDIIYEPTTGYRQERIEISGYRSDNWQGSLNIPGFVFDDATIVNWEQWKDYKIGNLVKHKQFYYVAKNNVSGNEVFEEDNWIRLSQKPESKLLTNFEYRTNQFNDFYDTESEYFDEEQQRLAQHLIGYQKRDYLQNLIKDDSSQYKFYQGFIKEKGTKNSITKLFSSMTDTETNIEFYEDWAVQLGQYGSTDSYSQIELEIDEKKIKETPQIFEVVDSREFSTDNIYRILPSEIYSKSTNFNKDFLPVLNNDEEVVLTGGYVNGNDVSYIAKTIDDIIIADCNQVSVNDYIWLINDDSSGWNVLQHVDTKVVLDKVINVETRAYDNRPQKEFHTSGWIKGEITEGEFISVRSAQKFNLFGFYRVDKVYSDKILVSVPENNNILDTEQVSLPISKLRSIRIKDPNKFKGSLENLYPKLPVYTRQLVKFIIIENNTLIVDARDTAYNVFTTTNNLIVQLRNTADAYVKLSVDKLDLDSINRLNDLVQAKKFKDQKIWIDNFENKNWAVLKNEETFAQQQILQDPVTDVSVNNKFGNSVSVTHDNNILIVGDPLIQDGKVYQYKRSRDVTNFVRSQTIQLPRSDYFDLTDSKFGSSVSVSDDGTFLAVGIPNAGKVKSKFKGDFLDNTFYNKNDIVKYREKLWKAIRNIEPTEDEIDFVPFTTFERLQNQSVSGDNLNLIVTGNPTLINAKANHLLIRAPKDAYTASKATDTLVLKWNSRSYLNPNTENYLPFNGRYSAVTESFISNSHTIVKKVEKILYLEYPENRPQVGSIVKTSTGLGRVVYTSDETSNEARILLYIDNINGTISPENSAQGLLTYENGEIIGSYVELLNDSNNSIFGGWWFISLEDEINNTTRRYIENGSGLIYVDVIPTNGTTYLPNLYKTIKDDNAPNSSFIAAMSYTGDPGGQLQTVSSRIWTVRAPVGVNKRDFYLGIYKKDNLDVTDYGLTESMFTNIISRSNIEEWDGYIDYIIPSTSPEVFNPQGIPYELNIETDTIEIVQFDSRGREIPNATATAVGKFYKKIFNNLRVYINLTSGWNLRNETVEVKIRRVRSNQIKRIVGTVVNPVNDIVVANSNIGKLFAITHSSNLPEPKLSQKEIIDQEYYFYTSSIRKGVEVVSLPPGFNNLNYTQVYNIPADIYGEESSKENQGAVAIYYRMSNGMYRLETILLSEYNNRTEFGKQVKIAKQNNRYTLLASSTGTPGFIEIFNHGPATDENYKETWNPNNVYNTNDVVYFEGKFYQALRDIVTQDNNAIYSSDIWKDISWRFGKDKNFEGEFNTQYRYTTGSIVVHDGVYYSADTNTTPGTFNPNHWSEQSQELEFAGYLPGPTQISNYTMFADKFDSNSSGDLLIATNIDSVKNIKNVAVYRRFENFFITQLISSLYDDNSFGSAISINKSGSVFAVSEPENDEIKINQGKVYVYVYDGNRFIYNQTLVPPNNEITEKFGHSLAVGENTVAITSLNGDMKVPSTFDKYTVKVQGSMYENNPSSEKSKSETTFDKGFTQFKQIQIDSGSVYMFENIKNALVFGENIYNNFTDDAYDGSAMLFFGESLIVNDNHVYAITINENGGNRRGKILDYRRDKSKKSWTIEQNKVLPVDTNKIHEVFLYNKRTNTILTYLDFIDPIQGRIAGPAEQDITYKVRFDPANYTFNQLGLPTNSTITWGKEHVGDVWWKIDSAKFANAYQGTKQYQKTEWNKILYGAVEVYEWVESVYSPLEWDKLADTEKGLIDGISGKSLYGNTNYSERFVYDEVSQTFKSVYYFWVKDKKVVPQAKKRKISIYDIQKLIENPRLQGYRFVNFIGSNSFILNNCDSFIKDKDVVLCIRYNTTKKETQNIHTEYQIISDGLSTSVPHQDIELKWFNSLIGFDINKRPVPDPSLSVKDKYGIQSEPRQTMFVNREEALKQTIERINSVLKKTPVVDNYDISPLMSSELPPTLRSNRFDVVIDQIEELNFIRTSKLKPAVLQPVIVNGRIVKVNILQSGFGYKRPPLCEVYGSGVDAEIELEINEQTGRVVSAKVISAGQGYNTNTAIFVRSFTALVASDSSNFGKWALYSWDTSRSTWARTAVQEFDVKKFWNYVDWYNEGYNSFTPIKRTIDGIYQVDEVQDRIGDVIKINNIGSGGWILLERISNDITEDYTINYKTVGRQNGTIQFFDTLYDYSKNTIGFDNRSFDSFMYDNVPATELRIILETIKKNIFIGDLRVEYNQLFTAALRYVLSEQTYVDWLFKTSFIRINHKVGELDQDITFDADNLDDYENYVEEVKPYSTTIREFVSTYNKTENTNSLITDFDIPPRFNKESKKIEVYNLPVIDNQIHTGDANISNSVKENFGYSVVGITISDPGEGYTSAPTIQIVGESKIAATAVAYVGNGKITHVEITNPGAGYINTPVVRITNATTLRTAKLAAVLGNSLTRSSKIEIKFDRISKVENIKTLERIESFTGTGSQVIYNLEWPIDLRRKNLRVYVNNSQLLKSEFKYSNYKNNLKTYTRSHGQIHFTVPPTVDSTIRVEYLASVDSLNAIDRINFFYKPMPGMPGVSVYNSQSKDYSQLISGIDYGGVEITGVDFNTSTGWGVDNWSGQWDAFSTPKDLESNLDMILSGGNLIYTTASGLKPEDIIVDGDSLISPKTAAGPEELVQGQSYDSVNITVFTKSKLEDQTPSFAFSQFKDMLNRTHYKKYENVTTLAKPLNYYDPVIELVDASKLPTPKKSKNIPGIIFINGERIEYFVKSGNTLKQLRRGTLGTGVKTIHESGSFVINQSISMNVPYKDVIEQQIEISDGETDTYTLKFEKTLVVGDQKVFNQNEFEVFVGGTRLRKSSYKKFDPSLNKMDSPEGDIDLLPEFKINNNGTITLMTVPLANQKILIVRKLGKQWADNNKSLQDSKTDIAIFLKTNRS